jgi:hypothetical protein
MSLFAAPHSPTVKGNASGGRGAAPDPAGGNDFPYTQGFLKKTTKNISN